MRSIRSKFVSLAAVALALTVFALAVSAQSTDPNFPTPIETNEINGVIRARDIGDSRLTSYFYTFDGGQGDIFVNVVSNNFAGDIDIFAADALRPLAKMVIYPEGGANETGRLVYLRRGERLILRIEGRSPNDDPATYRIKFGGSFIALTGQKVEEPPTVARMEPDDSSGVRVNSVGTIVAIVPKPQPVKPLAVVDKKADPTVAAAKKVPVAKAKQTVKTQPVEKRTETGAGVATVFGKKPAKTRSAATARKPPVKVPAKPAKTRAGAVRPVKSPVKPAEPKPDPLASIRLVVELKDGNVLERRMSEVLRFSVDKGVLTVIGKNGKVERYSILDVSKVTIQ